MMYVAVSFLSLILLIRKQVTGEPLVRRADDNAETLQKRLQSYHTQTTPVVEYYRKQGIWSRVNAEMPPQTVWYQLMGIFSRSGHLPLHAVQAPTDGKTQTA